jgi:hypothetical protein
MDLVSSARGATLFAVASIAESCTERAARSPRSQPGPAAASQDGSRAPERPIVVAFADEPPVLKPTIVADN